MRPKYIVRLAILAGLYIAVVVVNGVTVPTFIPLVTATAAVWFVHRDLARVVLRPESPPPALTGPPLAKGRWLTGSLGDHPVTKGIRVVVYADRLVFDIGFTDRTIMADQIDATSLHEWDVQIEHSAPGLVSPVTLRLHKSHPVRRAILAAVG